MSRYKPLAPSGLAAIKVRGCVILMEESEKRNRILYATAPVHSFLKKTAKE